MKKAAVLLLALCVAVSAAACENYTAVDLSGASSDAGSALREASDSAVTRQNKIDLARQMITDWEMVKNDPRFVYTDWHGTMKLNLIEDCVASIKANARGSFMGLLPASLIPLAYELVYVPDGEIILTTYTGRDEITVEESTVTDIYETEFFYQFTDRKGLYFSILKQSLEPAMLDDYQKGSDLEGAALSAKQACEAALNASGFLSGYVAYQLENDLGNPMSSYGVVIPEDFTAKAPIDPAVTAGADGAAKIGGKLCYRISFYKNSEFTDDAYYVDAETPQNIFLVSLVDGSLIPIACQSAASFSISEKK